MTWVGTLAPRTTLVYRGRRTVCVEVPFVFKDVALGPPGPRR